MREYQEVYDWKTFFSLKMTNVFNTRIGLWFPFLPDKEYKK